MHIIIVGGGIGGLAAALSLRHHGIAVTVVEQSRGFAEIGAGIQIAANGALVLRRLGLEAAVDRAGVRPQSYDFRDLASGRMLYAAPLGAEVEARYGAPLYNVHRADLVEILAGALPPDTIRLGVKCTAFAQDDAGAEVTLADGTVLRGDAVIGADGIHSTVRRHLRGAEETHFANLLMWRSLIPAHRLAALNLEERGNYWVGPGRTLVTYWVRSQNLYSILASVPATEVQRESWTESGDVAEMLRSFEGIEPRARAMLEAIDSAFITGMYYRDPVAGWTDRRISLLGDAAHPMVPFLAQGACQSIEDAWVLASVVAQAEPHSLPAALTEYESRRRPRTTRMQAGARAMVRLVHEADPARIRARNGRWRGTARIDPLAETSWGWVWDYDVIAAAQQPAGNVLGHTALREGKSLNRPEAQRAFGIWKTAFTPEDVARGHDGLREGYERMLTTHLPPPAGQRAEPFELDRVPALRVAAEGAGDAAPVVLHFHGGGYVIGSAQGSLDYAGRLARAVQGACVTVDYRLAPEHPYPAALDDAVDAWRALLRRGVPASRILLSGESSGGGLALALGQALRRAGETSPAGILAVGAFADLTLSGASVRAFSGEDPAAGRDMLTFLAASYFQGHEPTDPMVSPLFGDFTGLPPLFLAASEGEVLLSDTQRVAERAQAAGVDVTLRIVPDSVHVFPLFPFLPETVEMMDAFGRWSATVLDQAAGGSLTAVA